MLKIKLLLPLAAALLMAAACTTTTTADGTKVSRVGNWEVRPNQPFRTEEGPLETYGTESGTALAGQGKPRS